MSSSWRCLTSALTRPDGVLGVAQRRRPAAGTGSAGAVLPQHVVKLSGVQGGELRPERRPGRLQEDKRAERGCKC